MSNELKGLFIAAGVIMSIPLALLIMWLSLMIGFWWVGFIAEVLAS
jgi:hypothetical protein